MGASSGVRRVVPFLMGLSVSAAVIAGLGGYGLAFIFQKSAFVYNAVKYVGIAYIAYLGFRMILSVQARTDGGGQGSELQTALGFVQGAMLTALNPKFYIMVTVIFAQFVTADGGVLWITLGFIVVLFVSQAIWLAAGGAIGHFIQDKRARRYQNTGFGLLLLAVAVFIALTP